MKNVIVTGAAGFFGINLVDKLLKEGFFVTAAVRPGSPHNKRLEEYGGTDRLFIVESDMEDTEGLVSRLLSQGFSGSPGYDVFYHLAWGGDRNDVNAQIRNTRQALKALEASRLLNCRRFICAGSQAEYGLKEDVITEDVMCDPVTAYGAAKLSACMLTRLRASELGIEWIWGRIFSLIGKYEPRGRMLPDLVKALKNGETMRLSSCTQSWDYLDAEDAAKAFVLLGERGRAGEIYNIANGDFHELKYYTELAGRRFDKGGEIIYGEAPRPFVSLKPSVEKLKRDTGWEPRISFEESLDRYGEY
ncbi:MAG TPA: NAD(P)-dependent oxidoreductase [Lachnospiraceae bacterium]|nr:NAD(P)-dependent oxidoreductase [Lachnospiraceae bacterium]